MAQDIFIKLNGIEGDSLDSSHKGDIAVLSWEWSVSQTSNRHSGSGAGKCAVNNLLFEHYIDKSSSNLFRYCLTGQHISEGVLTIRKVRGSPLEYLRITLQSIIITSVLPVYYNTMRVPRESVSLSFSRVAMDYTLQNAAGRKAGRISSGYDIKANTVI